MAIPAQLFHFDGLATLIALGVILTNGHDSTKGGCGKTKEDCNHFAKKGQKGCETCPDEN